MNATGGKTAVKSAAVQEIPDLVPLMADDADLQKVVSALLQGESGTVDGAWGSARALAAAVFVRACSGICVVVAPRASDLEELTVDLAAFLGAEPAIFPAMEGVPSDWNMADPQYSQRLQLLKKLSRWAETEKKFGTSCIVTTIEALMQPVPSAQQIRQFTRHLKVGEELDLEQWSSWLVGKGFERVTAIELPGEFAIHGGILDLFPTDSLVPYRIELFGDEVESIRSFDVESQRKIESLKQIELSLFPVGSARDAKKTASEWTDCEFQLHFSSYLPDESWFVLSELAELMDEGKLYLERLDTQKGMFHVKAALEGCTQFPSVSISAISAGSFEKSCDLRTESIERYSVGTGDPLAELSGSLGANEQVLLCCLNEGERSRLSEMIEEEHPELKSRTRLCLGRCSRGFRLVRQTVLVVGDHELFGRRDVRPSQKKRTIETRAIDSFLDLNEGDLVVHVTHGIGIYRGMQILKGDERTEENLVLEFAEQVRLFVPVSLIHLVQKYVGASKVFPKLSKIGSNTWAKKKEKVTQAVADMAADMVKLQAAREAKAGITYPDDSHWMEEFEAAFPYEETPDQATAIEAIREDMQRSRPMDRLICGDVGYGKTEVAMRAAFRAIDAGKQVAVLVPTTVLAEQHYRSFSARMAEYPYTIEMLSRFRNRKEQSVIIEGLAAGSIDLVVGTHRIVSPDMRFKDLGLVVIDEEQRFGVKAKEMLKRLRLEVDILTLSATPIPRTLHMSLLGIRDISNLQTPPRGRQAIETRICRWDGELIRHAIIRELNRNGQVYFVHNRVYDIEQLADKLREIVPEASYGIVHGQMGEDQLEYEMLNFVQGKTDVLLATTIIESGLDIPNANTMFIHQADRYGLADMHQLRGRVGRYKHRAYCYLLVEEGKVLSSTSTRRLKAIEEYSELGAGFKIAMRDLEIRGAGNILGTEQSGHISLVGYELYCQLLENAVRDQKQEARREHPHVNLDIPVSGYIPNEYIPAGRAKIEVYRKISSIGAEQQLHDFREELNDRFGPPPFPVEKLLALKELQILARPISIRQIRLEGKFFVFSGKSQRLMRVYKDLSKKDLRLVDPKTIYVPVPGHWKPDSADYEQQILKFLKSVLQDR